MALKTTSNHIKIDAKDEREVLFNTLDEDRFVLSCSDAISCAQIGMNIRALGDEVREAISVSKKWIQDRSEKIRACYATLRDGQIFFVVVPQSPAFDFDLANELAQLDILISESTLCHCEVIQVPAGSVQDLSSFIDFNFFTTVYGQSERT